MAETQNLRNEDFRKLLSTVRRSGPAETPAREPTSTASSASFRHKQKQKYLPKKNKTVAPKPKKEAEEVDEDDSNLKEILKNYRDRAAERRKTGGEVEDESSKLAAAYRAIPGDARGMVDKADLRKQAILESKYLGGDMEHTHLVKGLDYSLLNKVRSEIVKTNEEEDEDIEKAFEEGPTSEKQPANAVDVGQPLSENRMVRAMHRMMFKNELPVRNELFAKGRMAYVVELEDEDADIPTTLLRSLHDCPPAESLTTINANNLLISKLTQVLAYLRTDNKKKKRGEAEAAKAEENAAAAAAASNGAKGESIYDNEEEYVPRRERDRDRDRDRRDKDKGRSYTDRNYFDREDRDRDRDRDRRGRDDYGRDHRRDKDRDRRDRDPEKERRQREKEREIEKLKKEQEEKEKEKRLEEKMEKRRKDAESGGYDECYPGGMAELAGNWDSDEEDFTKMDMGQRKGPVNRFDFENEADYEKYQGSREALPKAAYQYGLKTGDGRKTRKTQANESKKIDRELEKINKIMDKRKAGGDDGGDYKRPKY
ncbi:unnamed protein product [Caenorhabditis auriculariae]|uniref:RED-like N-terminal domain-containing protein n=1 Tax=Caenorhabditis auriculariae TaxID=2777116 RepID=A0A8S1H1P0_9PELO|nr:unnamed protein product [Caenorhabditis auriculariae]